MSDRVTVEEYRVLTGQAKPKPAKYRNKPQVVDGERFDSKKEAQRWHELQLEWRAGRISRPRRQVAFSLSVNGEHVGKYVADFVYVRDGERVVEDTKGARTELYRLKRKLMLACHGILVLET